MSYETGVAVAVLWSVGGLVINLFTRLSTLHENMTRAGWRRSWITGQYKEAHSGSAIWELPVWLIIAVVSAALSWVGVGIGLCMLLYSLAKDAGAPRAVRDLRWRLKNAVLPLAELMELDKQSAEAMLGRALSQEETNAIAELYAERLNRPELADFFAIPSASLASKQRLANAAALRALADEIGTLPTTEGRLSLTNAAQVEEIARRVDNGADEAHVREAMKRIREGETLTETLKGSRS